MGQQTPISLIRMASWSSMPSSYPLTSLLQSHWIRANETHFVHLKNKQSWWVSHLHVNRSLSCRVSRNKVFHSCHARRSFHGGIVQQYRYSLQTPGSWWLSVVNIVIAKFGDRRQVSHLRKLSWWSANRFISHLTWKLLTLIWLWQNRLIIDGQAFVN